MFIVGEKAKLTVVMAYDGAPDSGRSVQCRIKDNNGKYWDGHSFGDSETWLDMTEEESGVYCYDFTSNTAGPYYITYRCQDTGHEMFGGETITYYAPVTSIQSTVEDTNTEIHSIQNKLDSITADIGRLLDIQEGNWEIKNNQMIFYDRGGNVLLRYNLYDENGQLTSTNVYRREKC